MHELTVKVLGTLRISAGGQPLTSFRSNKVRALLLYLLMEPNVAHERAALATLLWDDDGARSARTSLRIALSDLRKVLRAAGLEGEEEGRLRTTRDRLGWHDDGDGAWVDAQIVAELLERSRTHPHDARERCAACVGWLTEAVALYQGDFLAGFHLDAPLAWDEWQGTWREALAGKMVWGLESLLGSTSVRDDHEAGMRHAHHLLTLEPWNEVAHRALMRIYLRQGQRVLALEQFERCRQIVHEEMGGEPDAETVALFEQLQRLDAARAPDSVLPHNLPRQMTPFFGREGEMRQLTRLLLDPAVHLVTLSGEGGVGKSQLALRVASGLASAPDCPFPDGIWFVSLREIMPGEGDEALQQIAGAVGTSVSAPLRGRDAPLEQLLSYLAARRALLLLDNFEHLPPVGARTFLQRLLEGAPGVRLLVTSREQLDLPQERLLRLEGLDVPDELTADSMQRSSVQLFADRARQATSHFTLDAGTLPHIVQVNQLVNGLPLAIELAAAWVRILPYESLATEIQRNLDLLASTMQHVPARHRSMRAVFAYSWQLLDPWEQRGLAQLAIFESGFSREAATAITDATEPILDALRRKSLLQRMSEGRYRMHPLIQAFAREKLDERLQGEGPREGEADVAGAHSRWYLARVAEREFSLGGATSQQAIAALRADLGNIRAAWRWAATQPSGQVLASGVAGLTRFYLLSGPLQDGLDLLALAARHHSGGDALAATLDNALARLLNARGSYQDALAAATRALDGARGVERVRAHAEAGRALWSLGDMPRALEQIEQARARASECEQAAQDESAPLERASAHILLTRALIHLNHGEYDGAIGSYEESQQRYEQQQHLDGAAKAMAGLGAVYKQMGRWHEASHYFQRAHTLYQRLGDRVGEADTLLSLGVVHYYRGDYPGAERYYEASIARYRETGARQGEGMALGNMGCVNRQLGRYALGRRLHEEALQIKHEIGFRQGEAWSLVCLSLLCQNLGEDDDAHVYREQALELYGAIDDRIGQGYALNHRGHDMVERGDLDEAERAYQAALDLRTGVAHLTAETRAGLARVYLRRHQTEAAAQQVEAILAFIDAGSLDGTEQPFRIYLTCYQTLTALGDPRAAALLERSVAMLHERANLIQDPTLRAAYLNDVLWRRELLDAWRTGPQREALPVH